MGIQKNVLRLLGATLILMNTLVFGQTITMAPGTISLCSGTLLDPGGTANYPNNSNVTTTICSASAGANIQLTFNSFNTELNFDDLTIYDGQTTAAPILGTYGGILPVFSIQATNPTGCLTLVFQSDAGTNFAGFSAGVSCIFPCQAFSAQLVSSTPPAAGGFIDICMGQSVTVTGSGVFPNSPGNYTQNNANSTFQWSFGDFSTASSISSSHTYNVPGVYDLDLQMTDVNGCSNTNDINVKVRVSGEPTFIGTNAANADICIGQSNTLTGFIQAPNLDYNCEATVADTTIIPDGVGLSYSNSLNLDCFDPIATITNATDISAVCVEIEHSYIHDLTMTLTCPNGTSVDLYVTYPGAVNDVQFGQPVDDDFSGTLGDPYTYCFTNTATNTIYSIAEPAVGAPPVQTYIDNDGTSVVGAAYIPAGNYLPDQGFNNFIGCPINGDWTITITDGLSSDNGTIFNWSIDFDPALYSTTNNFTPTVAANWLPDPTITNATGNTITVVPTAVGTSCYVFESTDQFGCVYDTTICFTVTPGDDATFAYAQTQYCTSDVNPIPVLSGTTGGTFSATGGLPINPTTGQIDLANASVGTYTVSYSTPGGNCASTATQNITILTGNASFNTNITTGCAPLAVNFNNLSVNSVSCVWNFGDGTTATNCAGATHIYQDGGSFTPSLTVTDLNGCVATFSQPNLIQPEAKPIAAFLPTPSTISLIDQESVMTNISTGASSYTWLLPDNSTSNATSPVVTFNLESNESATVTLYAYSDLGCLDSTSQTITLVEDLIFYAPNTFTPNNDENNREFLPVITSGIDLQTYQLTIFNRWGETVFISRDVNVGWDGTNRSGKLAQDGVYIYKIEFNLKNIDDKKNFQGHVNLLR